MFRRIWKTYKEEIPVTELRYADRKRKYYEAHKEEIDLRTNEWRRKNKEKTKEIRARNNQTFREKMDAEYPGGYKAYRSEKNRETYLRRKAKAEAEKKAASSTGHESSPQAQPTQ